LPRRGIVSARSGLAVHRGTAHHGARPRPVLILGVVAAEIAPSNMHRLLMTRGYHDELPGDVRAHLCCTLVDELEPLRQTHHIDGLRAGG